MLDTAPKLSACAPMYGNNWYGRLTPWSIEIYPWRSRAPLIAIHGHPLRIAAELPVGRGADGPAATTVTSRCTALLQSKKLLSTEGLVVDLACCLNEVLEMGASEEVSQVYKFTVILILHIDNTPAVLSAANLLTIDNYSSLTANHSKWNNVLLIHQRLIEYTYQRGTDLDLGIDRALLVIELVVIIRVHLQVVKSKLLLDSFLERLTFLESKWIGLGNYRNNIDNIR